MGIPIGNVSTVPDSQVWRNDTEGADPVTDDTRQTSDEAAAAASEVLRDPDATDEEKTAAGSALSQTPSKADPDE